MSRRDNATLVAVMQVGVIAPPTTPPPTHRAARPPRHNTQTPHPTPSGDRLCGPTPRTPARPGHPPSTTARTRAHRTRDQHKRRPAGTPRRNQQRDAKTKHTRERATGRNERAAHQREAPSIVQTEPKRHARHSSMAGVLASGLWHKFGRIDKSHPGDAAPPPPPTFFHLFSFLHFFFLNATPRPEPHPPPSHKPDDFTPPPHLPRTGPSLPTHFHSDLFSLFFFPTILILFSPKNHLFPFLLLLHSHYIRILQPHSFINFLFKAFCSS